MEQKRIKLFHKIKTTGKGQDWLWLLQGLKDIKAGKRCERVWFPIIQGGKNDETN